MTRLTQCVLLLILAGTLAVAGTDNPKKTTDKPKLRDESKIWILRGLQAEFGTLRKPLPRGGKGLPIDSKGTIDDKELTQRLTDFGAAARPGEVVQITGIEFERDKIVFEINGGGKSKRKWYQGIEVGVGRSTHPIDNTQAAAPNGSLIELSFNGRVPDVSVDELKQMLNPVLDFTRRSATTIYTETLPKEVQEAIKNHEAKVDMDRDMVLAALGRPARKIRESKNGVDTEDWIYGEVPARVTIVTFEGEKVTKVRILTPGIEDAKAKEMEAKSAMTPPAAAAAAPQPGLGQPGEGTLAQPAAAAPAAPAAPAPKP